ncbi:GP88 family protein [Urbifossiella limnaea]|uniref:Gene product 88 domain-containing protein n=1 Tax=Urbifossiella limnaea TaxID=2528023 RepID=A0A517XWC1_9BACT|nr:hypothetical protein [Urbifossiella limnaea]QDU21809.1 hypothetical protein ETAA1_37820 [Urbifossiella limnaea]
MLTPGNLKLGGRRIWGFALPSGTPAVCPGMSPTCSGCCYAAAVERYRPAAAAKYRRNLRASRRRGFVRRLVAFLVAHRIRVVRVHTGGDFYSPRYARKWLAVARRAPGVTFFGYTRGWRVPAIKAVVNRLAALPNFVVWYSCDRDTGVPADVPAGVRLAWLSAAAGDVAPAGVDLVFRARALRRRPVAPGGPPVCPAEDGVPRPRRATCDGCGRCWHPAPGTHRTPLPVIDPTEPR